MVTSETRSILLSDYFAEWVKLYKVGAVRQVTLNKYYSTLSHLRALAPNLTLGSLDRQEYQELLNRYAETHQRTTVADFHAQLKAALLDALDEGKLKGNPFRHIVIKGQLRCGDKPNFLNNRELCELLKVIDFTSPFDMLIYLIAKTGIRFSEALGLTPGDFDCDSQSIKISKTWNYKCKEGGFLPTKNKSSNRTVTLDACTAQHLKHLIEKTECCATEPIFLSEGRVFNSSVNNRLASLCEQARVPVITIHALRHTHASLLIFAGVSIGSISKRLGHSDITTTQKVYLHVIRELEDRDNSIIMDFLNGQP